MKSRSVTKRIVVLLCALAVCSVMALVGCGQAGSSASSTSASAAASSAASATESSASGSGVHHATLVVEGYDPITITLDGDAAPTTVANFCELAENGYYNGLTFYRFVDGFCMQGGTLGNNASGMDASLTPIDGEFSGNGFDNPLADDFVKGTVAMARTSDPNSATSTFFVTLDTSPSVSASLNGQYAAFGTIDEAGMAIVDQIVADYLPNVTETRLGTIGDEANQAKIVSVTIED